jgi:hypothetical protein
MVLDQIRTVDSTRLLRRLARFAGSWSRGSRVLAFVNDRRWARSPTTPSASRSAVMCSIQRQITGNHTMPTRTFSRPTQHPVIIWANVASFWLD